MGKIFAPFTLDVDCQDMTHDGRKAVVIGKENVKERFLAWLAMTRSYANATTLIALTSVGKW